jgi:c-di-AMP phosphodiesterase-like protein
LNIEFFFSTMNDDKIFFKIIMLIFISNNFHFWIEKFKNLILKIKMWQYINSNNNMKKSRKKILLEIDHFSIKNFSSQSITNDLMTNQTIFVATSHSRSVQWFHELTSSQQKNYKASVKEYKRKEKLIVKICQNDDSETIKKKKNTFSKT